MRRSKIRAKLDLIERIKLYGSEIGLEFKDAFSNYDPHAKSTKGYVLHVVLKDCLAEVGTKYVLCEKDGLKKIKGMAEDYKAQGYETFYYEALAWVSGNECQISDRLLGSTDMQLVDSVLHEGWHLTSGLPRTNRTLEESIANAIGNSGLLGYCRNHKPELLESAMLHQEEELIVGRFIVKYFDMLRDVPKGDSGRMGRVIEESVKEGKSLAESMGSAAREHLNFDFNNAFFCYSNKYYRHYETVCGLIGKMGLKPSIEFLKGYKSGVECILGIKKMLCPSQ